MAHDHLLDTIQAWIRTIELRALSPAQLTKLLLLVAELLDVTAPQARKIWVRLLLKTAAEMIREEAEDLGDAEA